MKTRRRQEASPRSQADSKFGQIGRKAKRLFAGDSPALLLFGKLILALLTLISAPIVARAIGPTGRGETAAAIGLFYLLPVLLAFGIPMELRRRAAVGDASAALRSSRILCALGFFLSTPVAVLCHFTLFSDFDSAAKIAAVSGVIATPLAACWFCDNGVLVGQDRYRAVFALQVTQPTLYVVLIVAFWLCGVASTATVLMANVAGMTASFLLGMCLTKVQLLGRIESPYILLRRSTRYAGSAVAESATSRADQVLALPLLGAYQAGLYSVAVTVATAPMAVGQALGASYFGATARTDADHRHLIAHEATRVVLASVGLIIPVGGVIATFAIPFVFGSGFAGAIGPMWICLIATALLIVAYVLSMVLAASGKGWLMSVAQAVGLAVGIAGLLLLGPPLGSTGAAIASAVSAAVIVSMLGCFLRLSLRKCIPRPRDAKLAVERILKPRQHVAAR